MQLSFLFLVLFCSHLTQLVCEHKAECVQNIPFSRSYSLVDAQGVPLDQKLVSLLNGIENGVFIEVGANDGIQQSNTKLLEECLNWTGILIEPAPALYETLCRNRPKSRCFQCALGSFEEDGTSAIGDFDGHFMSSIQGTKIGRAPTETVLVRSLQSILDECRVDHIHFFCLDTEGYELNILKGIDFNRTVFDYFLIEITCDYEQIVSLLAENGYELLSNFSNYSLETNPGWDGSHNDYLFQRKSEL